MEASQQQRRPTIGQSAQRLRQQLGLDLDALDLADAFWLAQFIESDMSSAAPTTASGQDTPASSTDDPSTDPAPRRDKPEVNLYAEPRQTPAAAPTSDADNLEDGTETEDTETEDTETEDTETEDTETEDTETEDTETEDTETEDTSPTPPFPAPAAPALRTRLELGRSLRPLMRKVPSRLRQELDEAATVKQIAETGLWIPVVRPEAERWLELDFVVEDSKTTVIWERTIAELEQLMAYQGAFRTLRTWRLALPESASAPEIQLFPRWRDSREKHAAQRPPQPPGTARPQSAATGAAVDGLYLVSLVAGHHSGHPLELGRGAASLDYAAISRAALDSDSPQHGSYCPAGGYGSRCAQCSTGRDRTPPAAAMGLRR